PEALFRRECQGGGSTHAVREQEGTQDRPDRVREGEAMKPAILATLILLLFTGQLVAADTTRVDTATDNENRDRERLQGSWNVVRLERDGQNDKDKDPLTIVLKGDRFVVQVGKEEKEAYRFVIDATKHPKEFDIFSGKDPKNNHEIAAIYRFDGDTLTLC